MSHVKFYTPFADGAVLRAGLPGSPILIGHQSFPGAPVRLAEFFVPVRKWSDGTPRLTRSSLISTLLDWLVVPRGSRQDTLMD